MTKNQINTIIITLCKLMLITMPLSVSAQTFSSTQNPVVMVELFTSEGCSSCPPAEKFLNQLANDKRLWDSVFPMAFHVDYWDYLGWKDRFADSQYSTRQKIYASFFNQRIVYTPAFYVNGKNWRRGWLSRSLPEGFVNNGEALYLSITDNVVNAKYSAGSNQGQRYVFNLAVLGMGLTTDIVNGENAGRKAQHEFVVLDYTEYPATKPEWHLSLPIIKSQGETGRALVAWVSLNDDPRPLKVVGGLLVNTILHDH